tara:strand:+ start:1639 stop:1857 length:219 start_codon:yes stop_codon:yes gene_type:complete
MKNDMPKVIWVHDIEYPNGNGEGEGTANIFVSDVKREGMVNEKYIRADKYERLKKKHAALKRKCSKISIYGA